MSGSVSWDRGPATSRRIRALLYCSAASALGLGAIAVVLLARAVAGIGVSGGWPTVVATVGVCVAAAVMGRWLLDAVATSRRGTASPLSGLRWSVVVSAGAAAFVAGLALSRAGTAPLVVAFSVAILAPGLTAGALSSAGRVDPETTVLEYGDERIDLDGLTGLRSVTLGATTVFLCTFARGTARPPTLLVVPATVATDLRPLLEEGLAADARRVRVPNRPSQLVSYLAGGGAAALAVATSGVLAVDGYPESVAVLVAAPIGLLAAFLLVFGRYQA